jgi:hypothetical protein
LVECYDSKPTGSERLEIKAEMPENRPLAFFSSERTGRRHPSVNDEREHQLRYLGGSLMLRDFFGRNRIASLSLRRDRSHGLKLICRPQLEILEDRLAPAIYLWNAPINPMVTSKWSDSSNWLVNGNMATLAPNALDTVRFTNKSVQDSQDDLIQPAINRIEVYANYKGEIFIVNVVAPLPLNINGGFVAGGTLVNGRADPIIVNSTPANPFVWSGGILKGAFEVQAGRQLTINPGEDSTITLSRWISHGSLLNYGTVNFTSGKILLDQATVTNFGTFNFQDKAQEIMGQAVAPIVIAPSFFNDGVVNVNTSIVMSVTYEN